MQNMLLSRNTLKLLFWAFYFQIILSIFDFFNLKKVLQDLEKCPKLQIQMCSVFIFKTLYKRVKSCGQEER